MKLISVCGYEIPENSHRLTKKVLRRLKAEGIVLVNYDDSWGRVAAEELEKIAGEIGLTFAHVRNHQFFIADEDAKAMELNSLESDFKEFQFHPSSTVNV